MHSWAADPSSANQYPSCCYGMTGDGVATDADCMFDKVGQVSQWGVLGWEISTGGYGSNEAAVLSWYNSQSHRAYLLNRKSRALGCAAGSNAAGLMSHCWMGMEVGPRPFCSTHFSLVPRVLTKHAYSSPHNIIYYVLYNLYL